MSSSISRVEAAIVQKAMRAAAPGAMRTRRRKAKIGSSTAPVVFGQRRPSIMAMGVRDALAASEEARAVGFELDLADGLAIDHGEVAGPDLRFVGLAPAPRGEQSADFGAEIRSRRTVWKRPDAPHRPPAPPAPVRA